MEGRTCLSVVLGALHHYLYGFILAVPDPRGNPPMCCAVVLDAGSGFSMLAGIIYSARAATGRHLLPGV